MCLRTGETLSILAAILTVVACGKSSPSAPSSTAPTPVARWALSGAITSSTGGPLGGATVGILDGPEAGRQTTTDAGGRYRLGGLQQAGFTVSIAAVDYQTITRPITLTADTVLNVELVRLPRAVLETVPDIVSGILQPDGSYAIAPTGINSGTGCAGSIAGTVAFGSDAGPVTTIAWNLPTTTIVRPGERFTFQVCCLTRDQAYAPGITYVPRFTYTTVACP